MARVLVRTPGEPPRAVDLRPGMTVGRHESADIVLPDTKVSRRHAVFELDAGTFRVRDLGSTHGITHNARPVEQASLTPGDEVQIGESVLTFLGTATLAAELLHEQPTEPPARSPADPVARRSRAFYDAALALGDLDAPDAFAARMLDGLLTALESDTAVAALCEPGGLRNIVRARARPAPEVSLDPALIKTVLTDRKSVLAARTGGAGKPVAMAAPLLFGGVATGLLHVERRRGAPFAQEDLIFLGALAHLFAAGLAGAERLARASALVEASAGTSPMDSLVGERHVMGSLRTSIRTFAASSAHVLIHGESGTGKELVARAIHALSPRAAAPFVPLNCAALPEALIEAELFGHVKGAFTGATRDRRGKFALAHGGTLFLDEIGDLSLPAQAKLLRALQEGEIHPVGSDSTVRVDVRVVSASHKDLSVESAAGRFERTSSIASTSARSIVPPPGTRGRDTVSRHLGFLAEAARRLHKPVTGFTPPPLTALLRHPWPGNVRELQNESERAAIVSPGPLVDAPELSARIQTTSPLPPAPQSS
ncbi:MAG: sigma 54-interacting transcriptional regulator [Polyangiaceae bacterium]